MIEQEFGFNVNNLSFEGAGKMYEVLAQNATSKAEGAGGSAAMANYRQAMGAFQRYHSAAAGTRDKASAAMNKGTQYLYHANDLEKAQAQHAANDVVKSVNNLVSAGKHYSAAKEQADMTEGMIAGKDLYKQVQNTERAGDRIALIEGAINSYQEEPTTFNRVLMQSVTPLWADAIDEHNIDKRNAILGSVSRMVVDQLHNSEDGLTINVADIEKSIELQGGRAGEGRDVAYNTLGTYYKNKVMNSIETGNYKDYVTAMAEYEESKANSFGDGTYIRSKHDKTKHLLTQTDRDFIQATKTAKNFFKAQAQNEWVEMMKNPNGVTREQVESTLSRMSIKDKGTEDTKRKQWIEAAQQDSIDTGFKTDFNIYESQPTAYWKNISPQLKQETEQKIGDYGYRLFMSGPQNIGKMSDMLLAHTGYTKEIGTRMANEFNTGDANVKNIMYNNIVMMRNATDGSRALSQVLPDGDLARIMTTGFIAHMNGGSEEAWNAASKQLSNASGEPKNQLNRMTDKDLYEDMEKDAQTMGASAGRFKKLIQDMYALNNMAAVQNYDKVKTYFESLTDTTEYEGRDVEEYYGYSPDPFSSLSADLQDKAKTHFIAKAEATYAEEYPNAAAFNVNNITYLQGGLVALKDTSTEVVKVFPYKKYIQGIQETQNELSKDKGLREAAIRRSHPDIVGNNEYNLIGEMAVQLDRFQEWWGD